MAAGGAPEISGGSLLVGNSSPAQSFGSTPQLTAAHFSRLSLTIERASLNPTSYQHYSGLKLIGSKPNLYVEVVIDGKQPRKTEFCKGTYQPRWSGEPFIIPVTPYSKMQFRLFDHSSFKRDTLVAEANLDLYPLLIQNNGKCQMLQTSLDLFLSNPSSKHSSSNGHGGSRNSSVNQTNNSSISNMSSDRIGTSMATNSKAGELNVKLDGLNVDMTQVPAPTPAPAVLAESTTTLSQHGQQSFQTSPSVSPRGNINDNNITSDESPVGVSTTNSALSQPNGVVGNLASASHNGGGTTSNKHNGGRSKRSTSGSSQPVGDQAVASTSNARRLPPLNNTSNDRKSGNTIIFVSSRDL